VGEEVLIPWADHLQYDLAFVRYEGGLLSTKEPRLYRVQCKKARLSEDGSCIIFNAFNTIPGESGRRAGVKGYRGEVEYFGVYSPDAGKCYLVPVDAHGMRNEIERLSRGKGRAPFDKPAKQRLLYLLLIDLCLIYEAVCFREQRS
jgi:hypothetical protein